MLGTEAVGGGCRRGACCRASVGALKGMTKDQYLAVQAAARRLGEARGVPAIWFEAAYSA